MRATPRTRKPSPASHPRRPAVRAAPEPPGGLLANRREGAPAAREAAGCSEKTLPSSAGPRGSRCDLEGKRRERGEEVRQRTPLPESRECSGEAGTEAFDRSFPLMGEVLFTPHLHCFQRTWLSPTTLETHLQEQNLAMLQLLDAVRAEDGRPRLKAVILPARLSHARAWLFPFARIRVGRSEDEMPALCVRATILDKYVQCTGNMKNHFLYVELRYTKPLKKQFLNNDLIRFAFLKYSCLYCGETGLE